VPAGLRRLFERQHLLMLHIGSSRRWGVRESAQRKKIDNPGHPKGESKETKNRFEAQLNIT
jgi:hypothetical protein